MDQKQVILDGTHEENMKALMEFFGWSEEDDDFSDDKKDDKQPKDT